MRRFTGYGCAILISLWLCGFVPAPAFGQVHDHEDGFFLRLSAGGGGAGTEFDNGISRIRFADRAGDINIAIGGIVSPNLALHGTIFGWTISDPDVEVSTIAGTVRGDLTLAGVGGGITYYFMPANLYLSGTLGAGTLELDNAGWLSGESGGGVMFDFTIGKEWWVGDSWGIGVALGVGLHSIPEKGESENWNGGNVNVRFTATMN